MNSGSHMDINAPNNRFAAAKGPAPALAEAPRGGNVVALRPFDVVGNVLNVIDIGARGSIYD